MYLFHVESSLEKHLSFKAHMNIYNTYINIRKDYGDLYLYSRYHITFLTADLLKDGLDMYAVGRNGKSKNSSCLGSEELILSLGYSPRLIFLKENNATYFTKLL